MDPRTEFLYSMLGKTVTVTVDRPLGYRHHDIVYPINYGFIPGFPAGDGEEQDAYILGAATAITEFQGTVIGAIRRFDDCEDKLVVAPAGYRCHQAEIWEQVYFQERYFEGRVISLFQKSCGIIPYRKGENGTEFLVLLQTNGCWSFPKGHAEAWEPEQTTAARELQEETGLTACLDPAKRVVSEYIFGRNITKQVVLFPGLVDGSVILQATEVQDHRWVSTQELPLLLHPDTYAACKCILNEL